MNGFDAPRRFSSPPTAQELDRLAEAVEVLYRAAPGVVALRPRQGIFRKDVTLCVGEAVRIDTSGGQSVRALLPDVRRYGVAGLIRMSGLGAVDVIPSDPTATIDGIGIFSVSSNEGMYPFYSDGLNWYSMR